MQTKIYNEDQGNNFGKWDDEISKFLYYTSTKEIIDKIKVPKSLVGDYGGGNGLIKELIPNSISIDIDDSKNPDIIDNIITHSLHYDLVIIRYVLHYLNDYEVLTLFKNINSLNVLIIQFTNDDLKSKYQNSINEFKYFRTTDQLKSLLPKNLKEIYSKEYNIGSEFYKNRLGNGSFIDHKETLKGFYI